MKSIRVTTTQGKELSIGIDPPFILSAFEGYGEVDAEIQTSKSIKQDGVTYIDAVLTNRVIPLTVSIWVADEEDLNQKRQEFSSIFNPKTGLLKVEFTDETGTKEIYALAESVPKYPTGADRLDGIFQIAQVELFCPDPYWRKNEKIEKPLYAWIPMTRFPMTFGTTTTDMTVFGRKGAAQSIENTGNQDAPVFITITGFSDIPTIRNLTTGEFITLNTRIERGQRVEISTDDNNLMIDLIYEDGTREDIYYRMSLDSTLWKMIQGVNVIEYTTYDQDDFSTVSIEYQELYAGI